MDLSGEFHPKSSAGNSYALSLMHVDWCIPIVFQLGLNQLLMQSEHISTMPMLNLVDPTKILSNKETEFNCLLL